MRRNSFHLRLNHRLHRQLFRLHYQWVHGCLKCSYLLIILSVKYQLTCWLSVTNEKFSLRHVLRTSLLRKYSLEHLLKTMKRKFNTVADSILLYILN